MLCLLCHLFTCKHASIRTQRIPTVINPVVFSSFAYSNSNRIIYYIHDPHENLRESYNNFFLFYMWKSLEKAR